MDATFLCQTAKRFGGDEQTRLVVKGTTDHLAASQESKVRLDRDGVADLDHFFRVFVRFCTDIDPKLFEGRRLGAVRWLEGLNRLSADHPSNFLTTMHPNPLTDLGRDIRAADGAEIEESVFINVMDDETDFIHVAREHDPN
jgi:hypothetical protein